MYIIIEIRTCVENVIASYVKSWIVGTNLRGVYDKTSLVLYLWALSHNKLQVIEI